MLEDYIKLKESYPKSVIMIKSGNFYECLNEDAIVMNNLFGYKIKKLRKYNRVGFPLSTLVKVTGELTKKEVNYVIVSDGEITNEKLNHNKYNDYVTIIGDKSNDESDYDALINHELALKKIKLINKELNDNIDNPKIIDILNEIERVICKINF